MWDIEQVHIDDLEIIIKKNLLKKDVDQVLDEIFEGLLDHQGNMHNDCISIYSLDQMNALNCQAEGSYYDCDGNHLFDFEIRSGDWNGEEVLQIAEPDNLVPTKRYYTKHYFERNTGINFNDNQFVEKDIKSSEVQEMCRSMNYDFYFEPTSNIRQHYNEYAASINCTIRSEEVEINN